MDVLNWIERNQLLTVTLILAVAAGISVVLSALRGLAR